MTPEILKGVVSHLYGQYGPFEKTAAAQLLYRLNGPLIEEEVLGGRFVKLSHASGMDPWTAAWQVACNLVSIRKVASVEGPTSEIARYYSDWADDLQKRATMGGLIGGAKLMGKALKGVGGKLRGLSKAAPKLAPAAPKVAPSVSRTSLQRASGMSKNQFREAALAKRTEEAFKQQSKQQSTKQRLIQSRQERGAPIDRPPPPAPQQAVADPQQAPAAPPTKKPPGFIDQAAGLGTMGLMLGLPAYMALGGGSAPPTQPYPPQGGYHY